MVNTHTFVVNGRDNGIVSERWEVRSDELLRWLHWTPVLQWEDRKTEVYIQCRHSRCSTPVEYLWLLIHVNCASPKTPIHCHLLSFFMVHGKCTSRKTLQDIALTSELVPNATHFVSFFCFRFAQFLEYSVCHQQGLLVFEAFQNAHSCHICRQWKVVSNTSPVHDMQHTLREMPSVTFVNFKTLQPSDPIFGQRYFSAGSDSPSRHCMRSFVISQAFARRNKAFVYLLLCWSALVQSATTASYFFWRMSTTKWKGWNKLETITSSHYISFCCASLGGNVCLTIRFASSGRNFVSGYAVFLNLLDFLCSDKSVLYASLRSIS